MADYDVDVSRVPESVADVPVLAHVCPVAWANGATVRAPVVDPTFLDSLRAVGRELVDTYPAFMEGGRVEVGEAVETEVPHESENPAMLFSGGVGSLANRR